MLKAILTTLVLAAGPVFADCSEPASGSSRAPLLSPPLGAVVTGTGRLQFYAAPDASCAMKGVFVVPKDALVAYARTGDGWTSVMYLHPKTGDHVNGWVRSSRLRATGTMGPSDSNEE
jgi:hypothetical protein